MKSSRSKQEWRQNTVEPALKRFPERQEAFENSSGIDVDALYAPDDMESFVQAVCEKIEIEPEQFGNYRAMVLSTGRMKGAPDFMQEAAKKLKAL